MDLPGAKQEDIGVSIVQEDQEVKRFRHDDTPGNSLR
jgi:hypothetical protein